MAIVFRPPQRRIIPSSGFGGALKIDWSHPIANGIVAAFVPGVSGVIDLCGGLTLAQGTAATFDAASEGPAMSHAAAGTGPFGTVPSGHALRSWAKLSYYWRGAVGASLGATANARLIGVNYDSVSTSPFITAALYLDNGSPTNPNTWKAAWNAGGSFSIATNHSAISVTAGAVFSAAATYNQSGNVKSYSNGLLFDTTAWGAGAPTYGSAPQFCLGSDPSSLSAGLKVFVAFAWNRELGAEEIAALDADPYCFLIPAEAELPMVYSPPIQFSGLGGDTAKRRILSASPSRLQIGGKQVLTGPLKIDWSHPLTRGLAGCWVPGVAFGRDLTGNCPDLAFQGAQTGVAWANITADGPALYANKGYDGLLGLAPASLKFTTGGMSSYWRGAIFSTTAGPGALIGIAYNDPETAPYGCYNIGLINTTISTSWNTGGTYTGGTTAGFSVGQQHSWAGTFLIGGNAKLYKNGVLQATDAFGASAPTYTSTSKITITTQTADGNRLATAATNIALIYNRELSADEIAALDADPYCFLISAEAELPLLYAPPTQFSGTNAVNPQNWKLLPRNPGRLPDGVLRGLTGRWPLDDSSNDNVVRDVVGSTYLIKDSQAPLLAAGPVPGSRGLQFGVDSAGSPNSNNELNWLTSPIPQTGWTGTCSFWTWLDAINSVDGFTARHIALGTTTPFCTSYNSNSFQFEYGGGNQFATTAFGVATGRWYHVCIVFTGSACTFYINGVADASLGTFDGSSPARAGVYSVGGRGLTVGGGGGADRTLAGRILDIRFYTGTLLTPAEVSQLYNSAFEVPEVMPSLYLAAATGFIPAWARGSNLPIIGGGHI